MDDARMQQKCAQAIGLVAEIRKSDALHGDVDGVFVWMPDRDEDYGWWYSPLMSDGQAMALVRKLRLNIEAIEVGQWMVTSAELGKKHGEFVEAHDASLHRAIVKCVSSLPAPTSPPPAAASPNPAGSQASE